MDESQLWIDRGGAEAYRDIGIFKKKIYKFDKFNLVWVYKTIVIKNKILFKKLLENKLKL